MARLVEGCLRWQKDGLEPPEKVKLATEEYREEMDVLADYMEERCVVGRGQRVIKKQLDFDYVEWCEDMKQRPQNYALFNRQLSERDFRTKVTSMMVGDQKRSIRVWQGLSLKRFEVPESEAASLTRKMNWGDVEA